MEFELLGVVSAARLERGEPAAEAGKLIRRQLGHSFGEFFDLHVAQYSTAGVWLCRGRGLVSLKAHAAQTYDVTADEDMAGLRIELEDITPLIWRRVAVRSSMNLKPAAKCDPGRNVLAGLSPVEVRSL